MTVSLSKEEALREVERLAALHRTLGDPVRLRIVNMLLEEPVCVKALCAVLEMSQPRVSRHMAVLRGNGMTFTKREGKFVFYNLDYRKECQKIFECIISARENFPLLKEDLKRLKEVQEEIC